MFLGLWIQRCPRVVPRSLPGTLQGPNLIQKGTKMDVGNRETRRLLIEENTPQIGNHAGKQDTGLNDMLCFVRVFWSYLEFRLGGKTYGGISYPGPK